MLFVAGGIFGIR